MSRLPTYENCQPPEGEEPDPTQIFQWAFVALPFSGSTPLIVQPQVRPEWSKLFWDMGFRHHPELQTKKVRAPFRGPKHALNGSVQIVDMDDDGPGNVVLPDPEEYTQFEQQALAERLYFAGALKDVIPAGHEQTASVDTGELFNPADHTPSTVNGYLMAASPAERRRVIAAEMTGKCRTSILNKHRGV